jgi:glutamyl-tRNA synthetase
MTQETSQQDSAAAVADIASDTKAKHSQHIALPDNVRVRFCPSPTGTPHVGMVRTALFNWAQARHSHGTFVFRIEDTDAVRDSEESYNQILDALKWLGIDWDEGVEVGGPDGPYRQSERSAIYSDVAQKLLDAGYAYESYSTSDEIEARNLAAGRPKAFGYDGYDRDLTEEQKAAFRAEGRKPALRIRMPDDDVAFDDLIRGRIEFKGRFSAGLRDRTAERRPALHPDQPGR